MREYGESTGTAPAFSYEPEQHFSLPVKNAEGSENIEEIHLDNMQGANRQRNAVEKLGLILSPIPSEEKNRKKWNDFYNNLTEAISAGTAKNSKAKAASDGYMINNAGKINSMIDGQLLAMLSAKAQQEKHANLGLLVEQVMSKIKQNVARYNTKDVSPENIARFFDTGKTGLASALEYYMSRIELPVKPGQERKLFVQDKLDTESATDFIELLINYRGDQMNIEELNFVQVKSKTLDTAEQQKIISKHKLLADSLVKHLEELQERYYPGDAEHKNANDQADLLLDVIGQCLENNSSTKEKLAIFQTLLDESTNPEALKHSTPDGKYRHKAGQLFALINNTLEIGATNYMHTMENLIEHYIRTLPPKSYQVIVTQLRRLDQGQNTVITLFIDKLANNLNVHEMAETPKITPIKSMNSFITKGKTILTTTKLSDAPSYMTARGH